MLDLIRQGTNGIKAVYQRRTTSLTFLAYGLLSILMTWPLVARLGRHIPAGTGGDVWVHRWTYWWVKNSILNRQNPFFTNLLFYPKGVSLTSHNIAWFNIALWIPLQAVVGGDTAYSLIYLINFTLNCFAMYLLIREFTSSTPASFVGGLIFGFWPYAMSQTGHPNMINIFWVPLALLFLKRTLEGERVWDAFLTAMCLALLGISRWQLLLISGVAIAIYLVWMVLANRAYFDKRKLALLILVGITMAVLMAPLGIPVILAQLSRDFPEDIILDEHKWGTNLLTYVIPNINLKFWAIVVKQLPERFQSPYTRIDFIGYMAISLAVFGTVKKWRSARIWVLIGLVYIVLALGSELRIGYQAYPQVPMPYRLVQDIFIFRIIRMTHRFNILLGLPFAMLAALGVKSLLVLRLFKNKTSLLILIISAMILSGYWLYPYRTSQVWEKPGWYHQLAKEPDHFAILDLPMNPRIWDKNYMHYQLTHGKPLVEGHVSRTTRDAFAFLDSTPFLKKLRHENVMDPSIVDVSNQLRVLAEANVRYIVLHKHLVKNRQVAKWRDWLAFQPYHEDEELVVYRTEPRFREDFDFECEMTNEIGLIHVSFTPEEVSQGESVNVAASWGSKGAPGCDYDVCIKLINPSDTVPQSICYPISSNWPTSNWGMDEVVRGVYDMQLDHSLEPGTYTLSIVLIKDDTGLEVGQTVKLGKLIVRAPLQ